MYVAYTPPIPDFFVCFRRIYKIQCDCLRICKVFLAYLIKFYFTMGIYMYSHVCTFPGGVRSVHSTDSGTVGMYVRRGRCSLNLQRCTKVYVSVRCYLDSFLLIYPVSVLMKLSFCYIMCNSSLLSQFFRYVRQENINYVKFTVSNIQCFIYLYFATIFILCANVFMNLTVCHFVLCAYFTDVL